MYWLNFLLMISNFFEVNVLPEVMTLISDVTNVAETVEKNVDVVRYVKKHAQKTLCEGSN